MVARVDVVLDQQRQPVQWTPDLPGTPLAVAATSDVDGIWVDLDHRSRPVAVQRLDPVQRQLDQLDRGQLASLEKAGQVTA